MRASSSRRDERSSSIASRPPLVRRLYPSYLSARRLPGKLPLHYSHSTGQTRTPREPPVFLGSSWSFWSARYCGQDGQVGSYHRDEIREISSTFSAVYGGYPLAECTGCITSVYLSDEGQGTVPQSQANNIYTMSAARVVPTGPENVPQHYLQPIVLYLGSPAKV